MLTLSGVNQYFGGSHILRDMQLDVREGSCTCLMGRNGVGKTTLLKAIMGLLPLRSGDVVFDGKSLANRPAHDRARIGIGYVPQGRDIFGQLSVEENLKIALGARTDGARIVPQRIYDMFPVLWDMRARRGGDLSGGQQQQLAIGRALVLDPKLLILDEPTEGIQPNIVQDIADVIRRLNAQEGITVLLVEQKLTFARKAASRFCIMEKGRSVASGDMPELTNDLVRQYLAV